MNVVYRPVKLLNREALDTFRCIPAKKPTDGPLKKGKRLLAHDDDVMLTAGKNAALIERAFRDLTKAFDAGHRYRLIVPVNSYSMASGEGATEIVQAVKELEPSLRGAVIAEFFEMPRSLNLDMLADMMIPLLPFFDKYLGEPLPLTGDSNLTIYSNCNFFGVSLDLQDHKAEGDEAMAMMTKFWAEATKSRLKVSLQGVSDPEMVEKAQQYEIFAIDGPAIAEDRETLA